MLDLRKVNECLSRSQWRIYIVKFWTRAPLLPGVQILSISCSFCENSAESYVGAPFPRGLAPPPRGNPGSVTESGLKSNKETTWLYAELLCVNETTLLCRLSCHWAQISQNFTQTSCDLLLETLEIFKSRKILWDFVETYFPLEINTVSNSCAKNWNILAGSLWPSG